MPIPGLARRAAAAGRRVQVGRPGFPAPPAASRKPLRPGLGPDPRGLAARSPGALACFWPCCADTGVFVPPARGGTHSPLLWTCRGVPGLWLAVLGAAGAGDGGREGHARWLGAEAEGGRLGPARGLRVGQGAWGLQACQPGQGVARHPPCPSWWGTAPGLAGRLRGSPRQLLPAWSGPLPRLVQRAGCIHLAPASCRVPVGCGTP